jgi:hypothetical protein
MRDVRLLLVLMSMFVVASTALAAGPLTPGQWQITLQTIKPIKTPEMVTEVCVAPNKGDSLDAPKMRPTDDCQPSGVTLTSGRIAYVVDCAKSKRHVVTDIAIKGDSYAGTITVTFPEGEIVQTIEAHRIGACPAAQ